MRARGLTPVSAAHGRAELETLHTILGFLCSCLYRSHLSAAGRWAPGPGAGMGLPFPLALAQEPSIHAWLFPMPFGEWQLFASTAAQVATA